jgi:hypothetical protein
MKMEKCLMCEKEFEKKTNSKYCSAECKGNAILKNQRKFSRSDSGRRYHRDYFSLRSAIFNEWKKEHPDLYAKEMRKLRDD